MENVILVALGANLPIDLGAGAQSPAKTIVLALQALASAGLRVTSSSSLFATPCFPAGAGPDYVNAAAILSVDERVSAQSVLDILHDVEARFGRERSFRWAGRTLDLDLLAIGDQVLPDLATYCHWQGLPLAEQARLAPSQLILPHPRLADRAFVLVPLAEIAPEWRHPVTRQTVRAMCAALPQAEREAVRWLAGTPIPKIVE